LIAITNRDLRAEVEAGRFRRDLFYRISVTSLTVPPLRDRGDDIEPMVEHFNRMLSARHRLPMRRFAADAMDALRRYRWPGNVRELRNLIERLLLTSDDELVTLEDLPADLIDDRPPSGREAAGASIGDAERDAIVRALDHEHGNLAAAARRLGVSRSTIYRKMSHYGLNVRF
jgi:sigma-54 dependent transcriptional regulator, acetoin dehydrogenase operon transcriptional activator AcoR